MLRRVAEELQRFAPWLIVLGGIGTFLFAASSGCQISGLVMDVESLEGRVAGYLLGAFLTLIGIGWLFYRETDSRTVKSFYQSENLVTGEHLEEMVRGQLSSDAVCTIQLVLDRIEPNLSGKQVARIIAPLHSRDQVKALSLLSSKMRGPLSPREVQGILSGMVSKDAVQASEVLKNVR